MIRDLMHSFPTFLLHYLTPSLLFVFCVFVIRHADLFDSLEAWGVLVPTLFSDLVKCLPTRQPQNPDS